MGIPLISGPASEVNAQIQAQLTWLAAGRPFVLSADETAIVSNTLAAINNLGRDVVSGKVYEFKITLWVTDSNSEGIKVDLNGGSAAMAWFRAKYFGLDNDSVAIIESTTALATAINRDSFSGKLEITGAFSPSSSGTFAPRVAQKAHSSGSLTLLKGSSSSVQETA